MEKKGGNASKDDCQDGWNRKQQNQNSGAQYPDASGGTEGQGKDRASEYGKGCCHRGQAAAGVAAFFGDFFAFGITTSI